MKGRGLRILAECNQRRVLGMPDPNGQRGVVRSSVRGDTNCQKPSVHKMNASPSTSDRASLWVAATAPCMPIARCNRLGLMPSVEKPASRMRCITLWSEVCSAMAPCLNRYSRLSPKLIEEAESTWRRINGPATASTGRDRGRQRFGCKAQLCCPTSPARSVAQTHPDADRRF